MPRAIRYFISVHIRHSGHRCHQKEFLPKFTRYWTVDTESEKDRIQDFVDKGNYHAAINIALSAVNEGRRNNDQAGVDEFIDIIKGIVQTLAEEFGSKVWLNEIVQIPFMESHCVGGKDARKTTVLSTGC